VTGATVDLAAVRARVDLVEDPEVPITLSDLGVVRRVAVEDAGVTVTLRPTRLACPARPEMERRVRAAVADAAPGVPVEVRWELAPWQATDVSRAGSTVLVQIGYADPAVDTARCPYCDSVDVLREGTFGGSVCKTPYSCRGCGSTFDVLRNTPAERSGR
jgi:ring-1,2-phenylacetyl-CoA epoxidase subunit PaaD